MRVRHERPMSDLDFKVRAPLKLTLVGGDTVAIEEWSLTGITFPKPAAILPKAGTLAIPFQGVEVKFDVRFRDGSEAGELLFDGLTGRQRETLAVFYRSILSGKMASTEDMITSLDTPVDLVPMGETEEEETVGRAKEKSRSLRVVWNIALYLLFAFFVFGMIGGQIWNRLSHVKLEHARIVAPIVELKAPQAAFVDAVLVEPGQIVERGETLIEISNPDIEGDLEDVREDIVYQERLVSEAEARLAAHRRDYENQREMLRLAFLDALERRGIEDFPMEYRLQDVQRAKEELDRFDGNHAARTDIYFDVERQFLAELEEAERKLSRLRRDLGNVKDQISAADIVATVDGVVLSVDIFEDQFISRGQLAVQIEENAPRVVRAWLSEDRAGSIYVGMPATVRFGGGTQTRSADMMISDITAQFDPDISGEFGLVVTATFNDMTLTETRQQLRIDAPAMLRAKKDGWFNRIIGRF